MDDKPIERDKKYVSKEDLERVKNFKIETSCAGRYFDCGMSCDACTYDYLVHHYHGNKHCWDINCFEVE